MTTPTNTTAPGKTAPGVTIALTMLRVTIGFLFIAHGWQKFFEYTIAGTQGAFADMGVPAADIVAPIIATIELVGGACLILGLLTRPFAALLVADMLGALFLVHLSAGVFVGDGGYELVLALAAGAGAIAIAGAGPLSLDSALFGSRTHPVAKLLHPATSAA